MKKKKVPVSVNLNDYITFQPTENTQEIYNAYYRKLNVYGPMYLGVLQKDGTVKMQMHEFIRIFGPHMNMGNMNLPLKDLNVTMEATICPLTLELLK